MFASKDTLLTRPSGGYNIARSVRLRSSASAYFNRTPASATNRTTWTWSGWVKRGTLGVAQMIFQANAASGTTDNDRFLFYFNASNQLEVDGALQVFRVTNAVFRDPSAWYHIVLTVDTGNATTNNRMLLYVNGVSQSFSTNYALSSSQLLAVNGVYPHYFSYLSGSNFFLDGYLTEINFIDGQALTPSSFGETDSITGVWKAKKYGGTYGTNGFYLNFSDNSNNTAATIGKDYSGNGNNWTPNNISVTSGATYDSMTDVPTLTSATAANYAVLNPLITDPSYPPSSGNLINSVLNNQRANVSTIALPSTGTYVCEMSPYTSSVDICMGICLVTTRTQGSTSTVGAGAVGDYLYYQANGNKISSAGSVAYGSALAVGDILGIVVDTGAGTITFYKNGTSLGQAYSGLSGTFVFCAVGATAGTNSSVSANFGQRPFSYTYGSAVALNTNNLPASTIKNGGLYMKPVLYTGDGTTNKSITGVGFQTDFNWTKSRSSASYSHQLSDSVRGFSKYLYSNATNSEGTDATNHIQSVNSDGYVINSGASFNASGVTYVAWNWLCNAGSTSSNTSGTITSTVEANTTAGFSVVTYTGTGANATVGHGLGVAPSMIILKSRVSATNWVVYHANLTSAAYVIQLNLTNAQSSSPTIFNSTAPTSSVFSIGTSSASNDTSMVAYCFAAVAGYSAFGSYTGNGSADGPFVFLGFRPRFVMIKKTSGVSNWWILDTSRDTYNVADRYLYAESSDAEDTRFLYDFVDILSNGFKLRSTNSTNSSSATYVYACFAEVPFRSSLAR